MKRMTLIGLLVVVLFSSVCCGQAEPAELTRVVYARGHDSVWGNQFRMDVCPSEVSYFHYFRQGDQEQEFRELYAVPIDQAQWDRIEEETLKLAPLLKEQKPPGLLERLSKPLGPAELDGDAWWSLSLTWLQDGKPREVQYVWPSCEEADALEVILEELAYDLDE